MQLFKGIERAIARIRQKSTLKRVMTVYGQQEVVGRYIENTGKMLLNNEPIGESSNIWVCWWQGEENMPEVVKVCYRSIKKLSGRHPVVLITEENLKDYVQLPQIIMDKYAAGIISKTHFSDILRFYLLKEHGGIWMDITNFLTAQIDTFVPVDSTFYSYKHITEYNNVSQGLWTSYFNASGKGNIIPSYLYDSLVSYWSRTDKLEDYLLLDFIFKLGYDNIPAMKAIVDSIPLREIGTMRKIMNKKWEEEEWKRYFIQAPFQKLSYKKYINKTTKKGEKTHYAYMVENY